MNSVIEAQAHARRKGLELSEKLGWDAVFNDDSDLFEAKLNFRNAAQELAEACERYRKAAKAYRTLINADNGDI